MYYIATKIKRENNNIIIGKLKASNNEIWNKQKGKWEKSFEENVKMSISDFLNQIRDGIIHISKRNRNKDNEYLAKEKQKLINKFGANKDFYYWFEGVKFILIEWFEDGKKNQMIGEEISIRKLSKKARELYKNKTPFKEIEYKVIDNKIVDYKESNNFMENIKYEENVLIRFRKEVKQNYKEKYSNEMFSKEQNKIISPIDASDKEFLELLKNNLKDYNNGKREIVKGEKELSFINKWIHLFSIGGENE